MATTSSFFHSFASLVVLGVLACIVFGVLYLVLSHWIQRRWPVQLPADAQFEHELTSDLKLRAIAEALPERFRDFNNHEVRCLGVVAGNAARVLFHAGPPNKGHNRNVYRHDYVLHVIRLTRRRVLLRRDINQPYSYLRLRRNEIEPLRHALLGAYGTLKAM